MGFDDLLSQMQSLQFSALANTSAAQSTASDGSFGQDEERSGGGAREARIQQETQAARQSEVASQNTRGADPSSVQNGVVSERHERVLAQQSLAAEGKQTSEPKTPANPTDSPRIAELPTAKGDSEAKSNPEKVATPQAEKAGSTHQPATSTDATASNHERKAGGESGFDRSNSIAASSKAIPVATTGAAAASANQTSSQPPTSAQRIGELLSGKTTAQVVRAVGSEVQTVAGREPTSKSALQNQSAKAPSNGPAQKGSQADGPEQTKRSEFESLVKSIRMNRGTKSSSATIRLNPPELGKMKIHAQMSDDVLRVRIEAASSSARHLLTERSSELLAALRERGIDVHRFEVIQPEPVQTDLRQGDEQGANVSDQSFDVQGDGQQAADASVPQDGEMVGAGSDQDGGLGPVDLETVGSDARLDVLV
jgi:flagellar hook-length control protein FliK